LLERLLAAFVFEERAIAGIGEPDAAVGATTTSLGALKGLPSNFSARTVTVPLGS
jgi:hypothetical protein